MLKSFRDLQGNIVSSWSSAYPESSQIPVKQPALTQGNGMDTLSGVWLSKVASKMSTTSLIEFSLQLASGWMVEWSGSDRQLLYLISLGRRKASLFGFEHSESQTESTVTDAFYPLSSNCYPYQPPPPAFSSKSWKQPQSKWRCMNILPPLGPLCLQWGQKQQPCLVRHV